MIPKIIHYTWFSNDPMPAEVQRCMDSWHRLMPDYEYVLWDYAKVKDIDNTWLKECLQERKWAFASDFIRVYAVCHHGGIYLDTDCYIHKSFGDLLHQSAFIGCEWTIHADTHPNEHYLTSHCFGAEKGNKYIKNCLDYYSNRHFILSENTSLSHRLRYDEKLMPFVQSELAKQIGYDPRPSACHVIQNLEHGVKVYPVGCLDCYSITPSTYCQHLCLGAWRDYQFRANSPAHVTLAYRVRYNLKKYLYLIFDRLGYIFIKKD